MTGLDIARRSGARVIVTDDQGINGCAYAWRYRVITLPRAVAAGSDPASLLLAAHEGAHHAQPRWMFWMRILEPVRWYCEVDAWRRAIETLQTIDNANPA